MQTPRHGNPLKHPAKPPAVKCNYCQRPTQIRRGYSLAVMIALIIVFFPAAIIYYFCTSWQCQTCKGTDINDAPTRGPRNGAGGGDSDRKHTAV